MVSYRIHYGPGHRVYFEERGDTLVILLVGGQKDTQKRDLERAQGMTAVARRAGLGRESLHKALSTDGNPELATVMKVMEALGLRLSARVG